MLRALVAAVAILFATTSIEADEPKAPPAPLSPVVSVDGVCTGFHISDGMIATAGHCVTKLDGYKIIMEDGTELVGRLMLYSESRIGGDDMAVIRVSAPDNLGELKLWCGPTPPAGTNIHMIGYPGFYGLAEVWGKVAGKAQSYTGFWPRGAFKVNISAFGGFSGSPVMATGSDLVLGILVGGINGQMDLALAVPAHRLCDLIGREFLS